MTLPSNPTHFMSPKLAVRTLPEKGGYSVIADSPIAAGELLVVWGGDIVDEARFALLSERERMHSIQVEEGLYQVSPRDPEPGDFVNHSCEPNAGLGSSITLIAMRNINPGEEICFDYAMSDGTPYDEFDCQCGSALCRGRVTGQDWQREDLQRRYAGYFSPYLQRRINRIKLFLQSNGHQVRAALPS